MNSAGAAGVPLQWRAAQCERDTAPPNSRVRGAVEDTCMLFVATCELVGGLPGRRSRQWLVPCDAGSAALPALPGWQPGRKMSERNNQSAWCHLASLCAKAKPAADCCTIHMHPATSPWCHQQRRTWSSSRPRLAPAAPWKWHQSRAPGVRGAGSRRCGSRAAENGGGGSGGGGSERQHNQPRHHYQGPAVSKCTS